MIHVWWWHYPSTNKALAEVYLSPQLLVQQHWSGMFTEWHYHAIHNANVTHNMRPQFIGLYNTNHSSFSTFYDFNSICTQAIFLIRNVQTVSSLIRSTNSCKVSAACCEEAHVWELCDIHTPKWPYRIPILSNLQCKHSLSSSSNQIPR